VGKQHNPPNSSQQGKNKSSFAVRVFGYSGSQFKNRQEQTPAKVANSVL